MVIIGHKQTLILEKLFTEGYVYLSYVKGLYGKYQYKDALQILLTMKLIAIHPEFPSKYIQGERFDEVYGNQKRLEIEEKIKHNNQIELTELDELEKKIESS